MKWFLLILMAAAAVSIFYFREDIQGMFEGDTADKDKDTSEDVIANGDPTGGASGKTTPKNGDGNSGTGNTTTGTGNKPKNTTGDNSPKIDDDDPIALRYPLPSMTLEQAVGNWNKIPANAFGRQITINKDVKLAIPGIQGDSTKKAGNKLIALGAKGQNLIVAVSKSARARGLINIDQTDFKQVLTKIFDDWKAEKVQIVMKQRLRASRLVKSTPSIVAKKGGPASSSKQDVSGLEQYVAELGPIPTRNAKGQIQIMVNSIKNGDVTEIKLDEISHWGPVAREEIDGKYYWTATVDYETVSMFGTIPTEAMALMLKGKVINWIYTGSEEDVP